MSAHDSSYSPEQAEAGSSSQKPMRKQGVSCDACKFRKVKCDRRMKLEAKAAHQDPDDIACSICTAHGLRCTFTQSAPRRRRGKRIVAIQRDQLDDQDDTLAQRSLEEEESLRRNAREGPLALKDPEGPLFGYDEEYHAGETSESLEAARKARMQSNAKSRNGSDADSNGTLSKQGLFGVRGLTRALLDACVRSYFKYVAPCQPILHAEVFSARYRLFFALFEEYQGIPPASAIPPVGYDDRPLSVLLLLAVGTVGAGLLEAPIAEPGSPAKFRLQDRMALRFHEVLREGGLVMRLRDEGADVVEACYVMSDPCFKVLGNDEGSNTSSRALDWTRLMGSDTSDTSAYGDPLQLNASSAEAVVRLVFKLNINRSPRPRKDAPAEDRRKWTNGVGALLTEQECFRRIRIFWSAFMQDSFRSFGMRIPLQIGDDDYDLDLPRLVPRQDGFFTALIFHHSQNETGEVDYPSLPSLNKSQRLDRQDERKNGIKSGTSTAHLEPRRFARFDALVFEVMLRLAFIIRSVSIRFVSHRSQGRGVLCSDIERAVSCLTVWSNELPADVKWSTQCAPLLQAKQQDPNVSFDDPRYAMIVRHSIKALFLETLYHANVLSVWGAVSDYGIRFELDMSEALNLLASQIGLRDKPQEEKAKVQNPLAAAQELLKADPATAEVRKKEAQKNLDKLLMKSYLQASVMARQAGELNLVRSSRIIYVIIFSGYATYGTAFAKRAASMTAETAPFPVPPGMHPCDHILQCARDYILALSKIDSHENIHEKVAALNSALRDSAAVCKKIRSSMRSSSATDLSSSTTPTSVSQSPGDNLTNSSSPASANGNGKQAGASLAIPSNGQIGQSRYLPPGAPSVLAHMDVDEVAMLARAAMPERQASDNGASSWLAQLMAQSQQANRTPASSAPQRDNITSLYGPGLDLDLEAVTGMDTQWLHEYMQNQDTGMAGSGAGSNGFNGAVSNAPQSSYIGSSFVDSNGSGFVATSGLGETTMLPVSDPMSSLSDLYGANGQAPASNAYNAQQASSAAYSNGMPAYGGQAQGYVAAPTSQQGQQQFFMPPGLPAMSDEQWQSFASGVDAQDWATSHWQGFTMV